MGYVGNEPDANYTSFAQQTITGNGGTSYTLSHAVASGKEILLYINNVKQEEGSGKAYEATGTTLTLSEAITSSDSCYCVFLGKALQTTVPPDGSVTSAKLATNIQADTLYNKTGDNDSGLDLSTNDAIKFKIAGAEKARFDSSGNLLVGKTSSVFNNVGVEIKADNTIVTTKDGGIALYLNRKTSHGGILAFDKDGTTMGQIDSSSGNLLIRTAGDKSGLRFDTNGLTVFKNGSESDDAVDLGYGGGRFDDLFATNGTIQTSDQNEKQDIASFTAKELNVAKKLSTLFKTFRWKTAVSEKGDSARTHSGIIAQEVQSAFSSEGLDATKYALFTSDTWWEENETFTDDDGKEKTRRIVYRTEGEATSSATKKTRLGVRYPELFSFIFSSIEARLTALEGK